MTNYKKILSLLVLLLTAATGAWATETPLVTINSTDYESFKSGSKTFDDMVTVTFSNSVTNNGNSSGWYSGGTASLLTVTGINGFTITSCKFYTSNGIAKTGYTVEGESPSVYLSEGAVYIDDSKSVSIGTYGVKKIEVYSAAASSASAVTVDWNKTTKTGTFTMPGGNVEVTPEYYPQAAFATGGAPVKIENVRATTDDAIVKAGTVKNIGESTTPQGTVMYYAVQSATAPTAPGYDTEGWSEKVPTAANFNQGPVYVWYYIAGANGKTDEYIFSDGDITAIDGAFVTLLDAPTYAVSLNKKGLSETEANAWKAKSTNSPEVQIGTSELNGVKKAETVTVTYTGQKKVIGVKAEKKAPTITWDNTNVFVEANQGKNVDKWNTSATFEGITISFNGKGTASHFYPYDAMGADLDVLDYGDSFTFTAPTGKKFAKIEINGSFSNLNDANWSTQANGIVWSNTPSNTVTIATTESYSTDSDYVTSIVFTLSE